MKSLPQSLFLAASSIIRRLPNWPKPLRSAIAYRFATIPVNGRASVPIWQGIRMEADLSNWLNRLYAMGETDIPERRALMQRVPKGGTFIDVGANVGLYTCSLARHVGPEGQCFAFEPFPGNYSALQRNIKLNRLTNVHVQQIALSSEVGWVTLYGPPGPSSETSGAIGSKLSEQYVEVAKVPCQALDSLDVGSRVDALKIDVEGNELSVLHGAKQLLARHRPALLIEVNNPSTYRGVMALAREMGYFLWEVDRRGRLRKHSTEAPLAVNDLLLISSECHVDSTAN